jgi:TetR/AcrR family transcriptional regulator
MRSERSSADTRNKILEVAEHEFARAGFAGAHLQKIAGQVGVQKTALYYYFPSKAALYEAVLSRILEDFDHTLSRALDKPGSLEERLDRLLDGMNALLAERRNYSDILIRIFVDRVHISEPLRLLIVRVVGRLMVFFKEGIDAGVFVQASARHMFQSCFGAMVFHYATGEFGAAVLGIEDIYSAEAVAWRRKESKKLGLRSILRHPPDEQEG